MLLFLLITFPNIAGVAAAAGNEVQARDLDVAELIMKNCREQYQRVDFPKLSQENSTNSAGLEYSMSEEEARAYSKRSASLAHCLVSQADQIGGGDQSSSSWLKDIDASLNFSLVDGSYEASVEFDAVTAIWSNRDDSKVLFFQPGFIISIRSGSRSSIDSGIGIVYRFTFSRGVLGFNIFYDRSDVLNDGEGNSFSHQRGSVGLDYQNGKNYISANYYFPITGWVNVNEFYREHALQGFDLHFKRLLTAKVSLYLKLSYWDYQQSRDSTRALLGVEYTLNCNSSIRADLEYDSGRNNITAWLRYVVYWGGKSQNPETCLKERIEQDRNIWRSVERERKIFYERARRLPKLEIEDQSTLKDVAYSYSIVTKNFRHVKDGEVPNIKITSIPKWLKYDSSSMSFSGTPSQIGIYRVTGTISLNDSNGYKEAPSIWVFHIKVLQNESDDEAPTLEISNQTVEAGDAFNYQIQSNDISGLREGEELIIEVTDASAAGVRYDEGTRSFITEALNEVGTYTIRGSISNGTNASQWSYILSVVDTMAPRLQTQNQRLEVGSALRYAMELVILAGLEWGSRRLSK